MNVANNINQILNLVPIVPENVPVVREPLKPIVHVTTDLEKDAKTARDNIDTIVDLGKDALALAMQMASETQQPAFLDTVATLIKSVSYANRQYMDDHKKVAEINAINQTPGSDVNIEKAIFVGNGRELIEALKPRNAQQVISQ